MPHNSERPRLLDITRLASRAGHMITGVDRVELAYLRRFLADSVSVYGLVRTSLGYLLLDEAGLRRFLSHLERDDWGRPNALARLSRRLNPTQQAALSRLRELTMARASRHRLKPMLSKRFPDGVDYYNTGHSNLSLRTLSAIKNTPKSLISILIHDTIPLDFPQYQRAGSVEVFDRKLTMVNKFADRIICNSQATAQSLEWHLEEDGTGPDYIVAPLGVEVVAPNAAELPDLGLNRPYFVTVGTIEPRKNHALLLDIWKELGKDADLYICGGRGWENKAVFALLDTGIEGVSELTGLSDGAIAALTKGARAALYPSFAEGYGLPQIEAAALGTPVICANLDIYRETLGQTPVYLSPTEGYQWAQEIRKLIEAEPKRQILDEIPTWDAHFKNVLN